ncbi:diguanylate cyclase [Candidatus Neomarinimicrobiota bacterium]
MICDRDKAYLKLLKSMLAQEQAVKFTCNEASTSVAIEAFLKKQTPDVIVLSLNLNNKSAMEWLEHISHDNIAPVIVLAGQGNEQIAVEVMKSGAYDYIPKHFLAIEHFTKSIIKAREQWNLIRETERLQKELEHLAIYDALTNILSRRAIMDHAVAEMSRGKRHERPLSVLMIDIDLFKRVNDTHGHLAGDVVIKDIAQSLVENTRSSDYVGRYGGEEFLVLLPETTLEKAILLAEKLRSKVEQLKFDTDDGTLSGITISLGVAELDGESSLENFIGQADKMLYKAKESGRNQVQA